MAADQGDVEAQFALALILEVACNYEEALKWYKKSALQGNVKAQNNLGLMYEHGKGVKEDIGEAASWYQKASNQ